MTKKITEEEKARIEKATTAFKKIRKRFIEIDSTWNACGEEDVMGLYRFLTGPKAGTMASLFEELKEEIQIVKEHGEKEIAAANSNM